MVTNIHEHKRYYYTFDNSLLFTGEHSGILTNLSTLNQVTSYFPSAPGRWHNAIRKLNPVCIVLIIPDTPAEKFLVRAVGHS